VRGAPISLGAYPHINACSGGSVQRQFVQARRKLLKRIHFIEYSGWRRIGRIRALFLPGHRECLRGFTVLKRRLVRAIHLARRSRLASGHLAEPRTLDDWVMLGKRALGRKIRGRLGSNHRRQRLMLRSDQI
jgi:hypothetical protein